MADLFDLTHSGDEENNNKNNFINNSTSMNSSIRAGPPLDLNVWNIRIGNADFAMRPVAEGGCRLN
jgi:hypothetical protein